MKARYQNFFGLAVLIVFLFLTLSCTQSERFVSNIYKSNVFTQLYDDSRYDFLWVFDNSGSMQDKRDYVKDQLTTFLNILNSRKAIDFQMAMTTTDYFTHAGALVESPTGLKVVKSSAVDPVGDFATVINNVQNSPTSFWEQGLESAYRAISFNGNQFMRYGVPLIIIILTDEDDYSCQSNCFGVEPENNPNWVPFDTSRYIDYFNNIKAGESSEVLVFPIVGTSDSSCTLASLGTRYITVQQGVELGASGSICNSDLPESYQNVARFIADRGVRFPLSTTADGQGIIVYVNGVQVPYSIDDGYIFESSTNSIVFTGNSIPPNGATVEVLYIEKVGS